MSCVYCDPKSRMTTVSRSMGGRSSRVAKYNPRPRAVWTGRRSAPGVASDGRRPTPRSGTDGDYREATRVTDVTVVQLVRPAPPLAPIPMSFPAGPDPVPVPAAMPLEVPLEAVPEAIPVPPAVPLPEPLFVA